MGMTFDGGGWTLASYGFTEGGSSSGNRVMVNMNYPNYPTFSPENRARAHGVISLEHGALHVARAATHMIMAASDSSGSPNTGGINGYGYVYKIDISNYLSELTFRNHNKYHGAHGR